MHISDQDILFASFLWPEPKYVARQSVRPCARFGMLRHLQFWILPEHSFKPAIVMQADQMTRKTTPCHAWLISMTVAYVLVLQLVLSALASAGHAAARLDPLGSARGGILCSATSQSASDAPDLPRSGMPDGCASICSPLPLQLLGSTATPVLHRWHLPVPITNAATQPDPPRRPVASARQPRAPPV